MNAAREEFLMKENDILRAKKFLEEKLKSTET